MLPRGARRDGWGNLSGDEQDHALAISRAGPRANTSLRVRWKPG
jgi:hypothetical protein